MNDDASRPSGPSPEIRGTARLRDRSSGRREALLWIWATVATIAMLVLLWLPSRVAIPPDLLSPVDLPEPPPDRLVLEPVSYDALPGWDDDEVEAALPALQRSCLRMRFLDPEREVRPVEQGGTIADWMPFCGELLEVESGENAGPSLRATLQAHLVPFAVRNNRKDEGLFTGYYEPTLQGSRRRTERYRYPLYLRPRDIIQVDLGRFREEFDGRRVAGRLVGDELRPYHDRAAIDDGALARKGLELVWVDDAVDSFFLHIQGSGRVELEGGGVMRVGYAGQNGHPYYAIGRELVVRDGVDPKDVSMQSIRAWLAENPEQADEVMQLNPSYVFFRELRGDGPLGSQGVPLEPGRSLAVDRSYHPMGAPVWLDATAPDAEDAEAQEGMALQQLMVAQDTGGAIRGPVRGDVFWGGGERGAEIAGRMKNRGRMWIMLPRTVAERVVARDLELEAEAGADRVSTSGSP